MTITVTDIEAGPFVATGAAQTVSYTFMTLTDAEIDVFYDDGHGRVLIDPSLYTVAPNKNVGSAKEGGSVVLDVGAAPTASSIYLRAAPRDDRDLVWSNVGSRLRNLNDEQDRLTLRLLVLNDTLSRNVDGMAEAGAEAGQIAGAEAAEAVVATKAEKAATLAALANVGSAELVVVTPLGEWRWVPGDQSAYVSADPEQGIWVAPALVPSGAVGAWKRVYDGAIDPIWFGGRTSAAVNAALAYCRATGEKNIVATGNYTCTASIIHRGNDTQGVFFDASKAIFTRTGDYGPTMMFAGTADGSQALQRSYVFVGGFVDADNSMTVANSPYHLILDHIFFVTWNVEQISNGAGFVAVRGCASDIFVGRGSWRDYGPYKAGSVGYYKGPSVDNPAIHGGDSGMVGVIDVYGGDMRVRTGSTSGSSTTVTLTDASGIAPGDIITGNGLAGDPYALIPQGTTVLSVAGSNVTVSTAVNLPPATSLVFYRCSMDDGMQIESCDGFWGEGFIHSICFKSNSFRFGSDRQFSNVRIKLMADFAPGASMRFEGSYGLFHSNFYSHHQYGQTVISADVSTSVIDYDGLRTSRGHDYAQTVLAPDYRIKNASGVTRYGHSVNGGGQLVTQHYDGSGVLVGNIYEATPGSRTVTNRFEPTYVGRSVADLAADPMIYADAGTVAFCFNARCLLPGGTIEGAGAGTGTLVTKKGDNNWYLVGTNILAQV